MPTSNSHTRKRWKYYFIERWCWTYLTYQTLQWKSKLSFKVGFKVVYWKEKVRPSRWPKLLAALSYAEKLIEVLSCSFSVCSALTGFIPTTTFLQFFHSALFWAVATHCKQLLDKCAFWQVYDFEEEEWSVLTEKPGHVFGTPMCFLQVLLQS